MGSQLPLSTAPSSAGNQTALPAIARSLLYSLCLMFDSPLGSPVDKENQQSATRGRNLAIISRWVPVQGFGQELTLMRSPFQAAWLQSIFDLALTLPWDKPKSRSGRPIKRSVCWLTDPNFSFPYSYANLKFLPVDFPAWFVKFQKRVFETAGVEHLHLNSCNVNYYHDGSEYVDWHADDEPLFGDSSVEIPILSLSVGQSRQFLVRNNVTRIVTPIMLHNGDLLYMGGYVQFTHQHMLPLAAGCGPRLNFTWRRSLPPAAY